MQGRIILMGILLGRPAALFDPDCKGKSHTLPYLPSMHPLKKAGTGPTGALRVLQPVSWSSWAGFHLQFLTLLTGSHRGEWHKNWARSAATAARWHAAMRRDGRRSQHKWGLEKSSVEASGKQIPAEGEGWGGRTLVVVEAGNKLQLGEAWSQTMQFWTAVKSARLLHFLSQS